ncbi:MAG: hypothetical protein PVJ74_05315 [Gammaproteobacteria bacterium]|jgi:hypothetical protein
MLSRLVVHLPNAPLVFLRDTQFIARIGEHLLQFLDLLLGGPGSGERRFLRLRLKSLAKISDLVRGAFAPIDQRLKLTVQSIESLLRVFGKLDAGVVKGLFEVL